MDKFIDLISKVSNGWNLAALGIVAILYFGVRIKKGKVPPIFWAIIAAIVIISLATIYLNSADVYRVRVVVLDEHQQPISDAKVICSSGGEVKKAEGGWECNIPSGTKPADGKIEIYASVPAAFLAGTFNLELKDDYNPKATIQLKPDTSAAILGIVLDDSNQPLEGVRVGIVGYDSEAVTTKSGGSFSVPAHKANGQQVQIFAFKEGYMNGPPEWHQAGDHPVTIILNKRKRT